MKTKIKILFACLAGFALSFFASAAEIDLTPSFASHAWAHHVGAFHPQPAQVEEVESALAGRNLAEHQVNKLKLAIANQQRLGRPTEKAEAELLKAKEKESAAWQKLKTVLQKNNVTGFSKK